MSVPLPEKFGSDLLTKLPAEANSDQVKAAFNHFPAAVAAICASVDGEAHGLIASSISVGVSYEPPMMLFSVRKDSTTWPRLRVASRIGISMLSEQQGAICRQLAARTGNRFENLPVQQSDDGAIFVDHAISWFGCSIDSVTEAGDHEIVVFLVHEVSLAEQNDPLIYHGMRFRTLLA